MEHTESLAFILVAFMAATLLILAGSFLRRVFPILARMHLPASIIGGFLGLLIGPQALSALALEEEYYRHVENLYGLWKELPAYLISIVFAALMMGRKIPSPSSIWKSASPNIVVGYVTAWGQYVVGIAVALFILVPFFDANPLNSALIAIGFQGGYGMAAGLGSTYDDLGFSEGYDLAIGMATAGKVGAILVGLLLVNIAVRRSRMTSPQEKKEAAVSGDVSEEKAEKLLRQQTKEQFFSADSLIIHMGIICLAIMLGWLLREGASIIEALLIEDSTNGIMQFIPLFPMALVGGILLQLIADSVRIGKHLNHHHVHSISHSFLDLLIVVAIATLKLKILAENWQILAILIAAGIGWNLLMFFFIAPRVYKNAPWTRGLGDFAHSTGATTTALMLMKIIDPADKTGARASFNYKQPFYELFVGGGFITALALPLIHTIGLQLTLALFVLLLLLSIASGMYLLRVKKSNPLF